MEQSAGADTHAVSAQGSDGPDRLEAGDGRARRRTRSQRQLEESTANRRVIVLRALEFFARNGYAKTTLQAVAESVDLTRTGLLHHFQSKDGLFLETLKESGRWADAQGEPGSAMRGLAGIKALTRFMGIAEDRSRILFVHMLQSEALHDDAPEQVRAFIGNRNNRAITYIEQRLAEAQEDGEVAAVSLSALTRSIAAAVDGLQVTWLLNPDVDVQPMLEALVDALARSPAGEHGHGDAGS